MGFKSRNRRRGRRHDATGRSISKGKFVMLWHWLMNSAAWRSLTCDQKQLYLELRRRFNGTNNGQIYLSVRDATRELHIAKATAQKAFRALQEKGFLKCARLGSFHYKVRHASLWILTEESYGDQLPTKEFMRWEPKTGAGPKSDPECPKLEPK